MPPYAIFMFIFSGAILVYAALMAITKDYDMLPYRAKIAVKPKDSKAYTFQLSKAVALTGLVPALTGIASIFSVLAAGVVFVVGLIVALWLSTKIMKGFE